MLPYDETLAFYREPGPLTTLAPGHAAAELLSSPDEAITVGDLPPGGDVVGGRAPTVAGGDPRELVERIARAVQGSLLHIFWAERYGVSLSEERKAEVRIRTAPAMLETILAADSRPLTVARAPEARLVGNCRDFTVLAVALLRSAGIPARARCGFATYLMPGEYVDHWVVEYWHAAEARWISVDAELDAFHVSELGIAFDPFDVPRGGPHVAGFVTGARAWKLVRNEGADPADFGIFDMHGLGFIAGDFIRDVGALNKVELLPWDVWGIMRPDDQFTPGDLEYLDELAVLVEADDVSALRRLFEEDGRVGVPSQIMSFPNGPQPLFVTLADEPGYVGEE
ncbi:MAG: transglutaminase-like domain-containing protein [Spirochaetota bacterium]